MNCIGGNTWSDASHSVAFLVVNTFGIGRSREGWVLLQSISMLWSDAVGTQVLPRHGARALERLEQHVSHVLVRHGADENAIVADDRTDGNPCPLDPVLLTPGWRVVPPIVHGQREHTLVIRVLRSLEVNHCSDHGLVVRALDDLGTTHAHNAAPFRRLDGVVPVVGDENRPLLAQDAMKRKHAYGKRNALFIHSRPNQNVEILAAHEANVGDSTLSRSAEIEDLAGRHLYVLDELRVDLRTDQVDVRHGLFVLAANERESVDELSQIHRGERITRGLCEQPWRAHEKTELARNND